MNLLAARLGDRGYYGLSGLLILGLVVLGLDPELLNRRLREGIALREVLAGDSVEADLVLVAGAVDEHVDVLGTDAASLDGLVVLPGRADHRDARRKRREVEEVAVVLRQVLDLHLRHAGADCRGSHFLTAATPGDDDRSATRSRRRGRRSDVNRQRLPH